MKEDRMRLARVRSPEDDQVGLFDLPIRAGAAPGTKYRRQTGDARSVSRPVATVYVVAADGDADELLCEKVQLV